MSTDWAEDVRKYEPDADDRAIAGIVRHCGIALRSRDASLVSFTDPAEIARVRDSFLKKKLGLTDPDETLDAAIAAVGQRMSDTSFRNRVTVYYLLAAHFGKLDLFVRTTSASASATKEEPDAPSMLAAMSAPAAAAEPVAVSPPASAAAPAPRRRPAPAGGLLLPLSVLLLGGAGIAAYIGSARPPLTATLAVAPEGAAVVSTLVDGRPFVSVYFDTASTALHPDFDAAAALLAGHLAANPAARLAISGFADPRGTAAFNAELARKRAEAVRAALAARGLPDGALVLVKPPGISDPELALAYGRRVDIRPL
jgi:outer membrane protein OmpA-like peptidoglycan-associated protein